MYFEERRKNLNVCCICIYILVLLPNKSHLENVDDKPKNIYFRKCCKDNEVYDYIKKKCIDRKLIQPQQPNRRYPINFVHDDVSALYVSQIQQISKLYIIRLALTV